MQLKLSDKNYFKVALPLFAACIAIPMFSESMLVAALPEIEHEFCTSSGIFGSWVLPVVLLVGAALCPFFGTLGDAYGRKKILYICIVIYALGIVLAGFSWDIWSLLFFRAVQGMGIAAIPVAFAIVSEQFPSEKIPLGIGVLSASYGAGTMTGIFLGSYIINYFGWRWTYYALVPVVIIHVSLFALIIRKSKTRAYRKTDWKGACLLLSAMLFFMLTITEGYGHGTLSTQAFLYGILTIICTIAFFRTEKRAKMPAIDVSLIKKPLVIILSATAFLVNCMTFLYIQSLPYIVQSPSGLFLEERFVGLIMVPGSVTDMITSPLSGFLMQKYGFKKPVVAGSLCLIAAPAVFFIMPLSVYSLSLMWVFFSAGMAAVSTAYLLMTIKSVPPGRTAGATGFLHSSINIGGMTGPIFAGIILAAFSREFIIGNEVWTYPDPTAFSLIFICGAVMAVMIAVLSLKSLSMEKSLKITKKQHRNI
ncbi:MFS family permease [Methanomicrobium sp. W14]|uniref:MFS transporter n=1 Tax=Methanomicrobium sp. W14 TaxID=2817839 RepID=UPI001AE78531|nr:MFS transporter [Methanomicrobium sp. W14]MBP2133413.1 MFS family permease [Methanomicrobium sp. W14]